MRVSKAPIVTLAPGVHRIPTLGDFINSYAFVDDDGSVTLVDCGLKRAPAKIVRALSAIGKRPSDVQRILLTHAHFDHASGAAQMVSQSSAQGVDVHEADAGYIESGKRAPGDRSGADRRPAPECDTQRLAAGLAERCETGPRFNLFDSFDAFVRQVR